MKKLVSLSLALMLLLGVLAIPAMADEPLSVGQLAFLNLSEQDGALISNQRSPAIHILFLNGVMEDTNVRYNLEYHYFDSLPELIMALQAKTVEGIILPYYTAKYLCATNEGVRTAATYHPEKLNESAQRALDTISDGYSFLLKEDNASLRNDFDAQITAMKEDGTLQKLIDEHIIKVAEGGEPVAVRFEQFEGDPIKVGVTGDLPPMDYVSADGSFNGFNTAVLAEIGRRLQKNIELVQVMSVGRSLALSEGRVDVVFWTRGMTDTGIEFRKNGAGLSEEELDTMVKGDMAQMTEEEKAIVESISMPAVEELQMFDNRDMPADTIVTQPYFSDFPVLVILK